MLQKKLKRSVLIKLITQLLVLVKTKMYESFSVYIHTHTQGMLNMKMVNKKVPLP